jgi:3-deoxy-D-manno-octulosonic-acid transferase
MGNEAVWLMMYPIYDGLLYAASALYYHVTALRGREGKARLAWYWARKRPAPVSVPGDGRAAIWIHGVSAGEVKTAGKLAEAFRRLPIDLKIVISSSTQAGYSKAASLVEADAAIVMPFDIRARLTALFSQVRPVVLITIESEYWPNLFSVARKNGVSVVVANANLSERSFRHLKRFAWLRRATVLTVKRFYAQQALTKSRLLELGVLDDCVTVIGNVKLSPPTAEAIRHRRSLWRPAAATIAKTITFGNLHPEEVDGAKAVIQRLRSSFDGVRVIIVPRHFSKFTAKELIAALGPDIKIVQTVSEVVPSDRFIWFAAMGILEAVYARSDIVVVCGTFCHVGGHDLVEPMHFGAVTLYGPNVERQTALHAEISRHMPWAQVKSFHSLSQSLGELIQSEIVWNARKSDLQKTIQNFSSVTDRMAAQIAVDVGLMR